MNRKIIALFLMVSAGILLLVNGCKKDDPDGIREPITLVLPDSTVVTRFAGEDVTIELKFVTDRPINWAKTMVDIDTSQLGSYVPQYADTFFFTTLDTLTVRTNKYDFSGTYHIPNGLMPNSIVRFKAQMHAGRPNMEPGQNYPAGVQQYEKQFRIDVN